jgi:hypothetical protein
MGEDPGKLMEAESGAAAAKAVPAPSPLTPEQLLAVKKANERGKKVRRAVSVAYADAWLGVIFTVCVVMSMCMGLENLVLAALFALMTVNSFRGAARMKRFDTTAPKLLAVNQLILMGSIVAYALYELWAIYSGHSAIMSAIAGNSSSDLGGMGGGFEGVAEYEKAVRQWVTIAVYAVYIGLAVGSVLAQGMAARYYASRKRFIEEYLAQTPPWVVELQKHQR